MTGHGVRVVGIGQPAAGDDGVGIEVIRRLRALGSSDGAELLCIAQAADLIPLIDGHKRLILVDALVGGGAPGEILRLSPEALATRERGPLSTHGLGVAQAIDLARALHPGAASTEIQVIAICIAPPEHLREGLSPEVAAAIPRVLATVLDALAEPTTAAITRAHRVKAPGSR